MKPLHLERESLYDQAVMDRMYQQEKRIREYFSALRLRISSELWSLGEYVVPADKDIRVDEWVPIDKDFPVDECKEVERLEGNFQPISGGDSEGFFAYFALTVALAELAIGDREAAIHLMEHEIQFDRRKLEASERVEGKCSGEPPNCVLYRRRDYLRQLILLLRLETIQALFLGMSPESSGDFVWVFRSIQSINDFSSALVFIDPQSTLRNSLFGKNLESPASCDLRGSSSTESYLLGFFLNSQFVVENNIIDRAGKNPSMIDDHPDLIPTLDRFAHEVETFDLDCAKRLGVVGVPPRANVLEAVGSYWKAKGTKFGAPDSDRGHVLAIESNPYQTIKALCDAKTAYDAARRELSSNEQPQTSASLTEGLNEIDSEYSRADDDTLPGRIRSGWEDADQALSSYSAAQVAEACTK